MKASEFEYRHPTLVHQCIISAAFLTYLIDRDDVVWVLVKAQPNPQLLERLLFAVATLLIGVSTAVCTWARAYAAPSIFDGAHALPGDGPYRYLRYPQQLSNFVFAIGLGFLAPLSGFVVLVVGEAILFLRLIGREKERLASADLPTSQPPRPDEPRPTWGKAFRRESAKWGIFVTMIIFTILLRDRVAEILAAVSVLIWVLLNYDSFRLTHAKE